MTELDDIEGNVADLASSFGDGKGPTATQRFEPINWFNLSSGTNTYRILPAMFSAVPKNLYAIYYSRHWGFKDEKGRQRPFVCTRKFDKKTKEMISDCEFCVAQEPAKIAAKKAEKLLEDIQLELAEAKQNDAPEKTLKALESKLEAAQIGYNTAHANFHSLERKFWVNAMNENGEFGVLSLPKTVYEQLSGRRDREGNKETEGLIKTLWDENEIDALDVNQGVWFQITRSGSDKFSTKYSVGIKTESEIIEKNGRKQKAEYIKEAPLSKDQQRLATKKCRDLLHVFDHLLLTPDQMRAVLSGNPQAVSEAVSSPRQMTAAESASVKKTSRVHPSLPKESDESLDDEAILAKFNS